MKPKRPSLQLLPEEGVKKIVEEALRTLEEVGVFVENEEAIELLSSSGARIDKEAKRAFIPADLVERCSKSVPSRVGLFDRNGDHVQDIGGEEVLFDPGSAAIDIYDFSEQRIRKPATDDVIDFVVVSDRLDGFAAQSTGVVPADLPEELADRYRFFLALLFGRKPVVTGTFTKGAFATMLEMLVAARGSLESLREKPLAIFDCCPSPPLMWSDLTCQALIDCARSFVPAELVSMPLTGATSPVTLAGALVQHTAENLSGVTIHQLASPGAPIIYGGSPSFFDMRSGTTPMGAIETMMIDASYAQIGKGFGFPVHAYMGLSDAKMVDYQAGFESAMGMTLAALAGVNVVSGAGMLDFESCQSLEKLVIDNEIASIAARLIEGVAFREEVLGYDVLKEFAYSKSFLTAEHTKRFFRKEAYYPSRVVDRSTRGKWEEGGSTSAAERAHALVKEIISSPAQSIASTKLIEKLAAVMEEDAHRHRLEKLPRWRHRLPA